MKKKKGWLINVWELIATIMMLHRQNSLLKVSGATRVTAFLLDETKPKPEEAKEYDRNDRKWKDKGKYKTGTNEVRKQELSIKRYKMFSLLSFFFVGVILSVR